MYPIMTDLRHKCKNYRDARQNVAGWHDIVHAEPNASVWRRQSATRNGNSPTTVKRHGEGLAGYIDKHGFHPHT